MDLIYTNTKRVDQGVLSVYSLDLSYGESENDYELILGANEPTLEVGSFIYIEGTEYGGIVGGLKTSTNADTVSYMGRTWHGILNSKVISPDANKDYYVVSGDANEVLQTLITRLGLSGLFVAETELSGIRISKYQFARYCMAYDGIKAMLSANGAKLKIKWEDRLVHISAEPIADFTNSPIDGDIATLSVESYNHKVNHLVCLGKGELAAREVIHLYVDQFGRIGTVQHFKGLDEIVETYDNSNSDDLRNDGIKHLKEIRDNDIAEINLPEMNGLTYDIGDVVGASEIRSGVKVTSTVTQKIVKINNGVISTEYKTGR